MPARPAFFAKYLLIVFAVGALVFAAVPAVVALRHGEGAEVLFGFLFLPWLLGPAALMAWLAARAGSRAEAWAFVGAELAAIVSTSWFWITLVFGKPDALNGLAIVVFPVIQFAILLAYALVVRVAALILRRSRPDAQAAARGGSGIVGLVVIAAFLSLALLAIYLLFFMRSF